MFPPCTTVREAVRARATLPDDVIEDIIGCLPAKAALRCRCLSRAWAAALSTRGFVDRHLQVANLRGGLRIFFLPEFNSDNDTGTVHAWSPAELPLGGPLMTVPSHGRNSFAITRQCCGLFIFGSNSLETSYLCNPSTGQITALPEGRRYWPPGTHCAIMGLGYDPSIGRHKVVRLYYRGYKLPPGCEVYVPDTTGYWRPPAGGTAPNCWVPHYSIDESASIFAQGHVYSTARTRELVTRERLIISFSIADEVFETVQPPPGVTKEDMKDCRITELGERLCVFHDINKTKHFLGGKFFDMWVLCEHRTGSWDLHCRVDLNIASPTFTRLMGRSMMTLLDAIDDGTRLLLQLVPSYSAGEEPKSNQLIAYTPATGQVEDLLAAAASGMVTASAMTGRCAAAPYVESTQSTGRPHEDIIFSSASSRALAIVLRRLPARTLHLLRCVCRSWRAMISTEQVAKLDYSYYYSVY